MRKGGKAMFDRQCLGLTAKSCGNDWGESLMQRGFSLIPPKRDRRPAFGSLILAGLLLLVSGHQSANAVTLAAQPLPDLGLTWHSQCLSQAGIIEYVKANSTTGAGSCYFIHDPANSGNWTLHSIQQVADSCHGISPRGAFYIKWIAYELGIPGWNPTGTVLSCATPTATSGGGHYINRLDPATCPGGDLASNVAGTSPPQFTCNYDDSKLNKTKSAGSTNICSSSDTGNSNNTTPSTGNPINTLTGNKFQVETDYSGFGPFPLLLQRYYNSDVSATGSGWGTTWRDNYDRSIAASSAGTITTAYAYRPDGKVLFFNLSGGQWVPDADVNYQLVQLTDAFGTFTGWRYTQSDDTVEDYDVNGKLLTITNRADLTQILTYDVSSASGGDDDPDTLDTVTGSFGRTLSFTYNINKHVETFTDSDGEVYHYTYDVDNNLSTVAYPDETPADPNDNPLRIYHYEDTQVDAATGVRLYPHALTGITNEQNDRFATWSYDAQGRAISSEHAGGVERSTLDYIFIDDVADPRVTVTNPLGKDTTYHFTTLFGVRKVTQVEGHAAPNCVAANQNYTYDANGNRDIVTNWENNVTDYDYDARNLETQRIEAQGTPEQRTIETAWHATYRLPTWIDVRDKDNIHIKRTRRTYNSQGLLRTLTEFDKVSGKTRTTSYLYNSQSLLRTIDGPRTNVNDVTTLIYDAAGNLTEVKNPLNQISKITQHDASGRPETLEDPNGLISQLDYDARGRLKTRTVDGHATLFGYDQAGNLTTLTRPNGLILTYIYDEARRLKEVHDNNTPTPNKIVYTLDAAGNRKETKTFDPAGALTRIQTREFDALSRLIKYTGGANQVSDYDYDSNSNLKMMTNGRNQPTLFAFDALNRLVKQTDADTNDSEIAYDVLDQVTEVTDPKTLVTRYTTNALGETSQIDSPDTGITTFQHDDAGNVIQSTDARGELVDYQYDVLNRLTLIDYTDNSLDVTFDYDETTVQNGIGRLTRRIDASGTSTYDYDKRGNQLHHQSTRNGITTTLSYLYNGADQLTHITYPSGRQVEYHYNNLGQVERISATLNGVTQDVAHTLSYLPFGPLEKLTYQNGIQLDRNYDQDYRLEDNAQGVVLDQTYGYDFTDNLDNLTDHIDTVRNALYTYDNLDRLDSATRSTDAWVYDHDENGNRTSKTHNSSTQNYQYPLTNHRLDQITGANPHSFQYSANGNITDNGTYTFAYAAHNRLSTVQSGVNILASYIYNGHGERVQKTVAGTTTNYHYGLNGQLLAETDALGDWQKEYLYLGGEALAMWVPSTSPPPPANNVTATANPAFNPPVVEGTQVTITAVASGGSGSYEYQFWFKGLATNEVWTLQRGYDPSGTYLFDTTGFLGSTNKFRVEARNQGSTDAPAQKWLSAPVNPLGVANGLTVTITPSFPVVEGTQVTLTATASGGSGNYEYQFNFKGAATNEVWTELRAYDPSDTFVFDTTGYVGTTNKFRVEARNQGSTDAPVKKWIIADVNP